MKLNYLLFFFLIFFCSNKAKAQNVYRTLNGDIAISITNNDSILLMVSNSLLVTLDYETSNIHFHVPYETFTSGIDSIDQKLKNLRGTVLDFNGKIGITINTQNFTEQKYNMEGTLTDAIPPTKVRGKGSMSCIPSGDDMTPACTLLLSFESTLADLNLENVFPSAQPKVRVDLRQSILEKNDQ